jgi:integrase
MRRRHQQGSLTKVGGSWIAQWWESGHRRKKKLGMVGVMSKAQAQNELAAILLPINSRQETPSDKCTFGAFVDQIYLPFYRRKWKDSTTACNLDRLKHHLTGEFGGRTLGSFTRNELQDFLDSKAASKLSFSIVDHLRWDLRQIFEMAVAEDYVRKNPALLLFTPKTAAHPARPTMSRAQVMLLFSVLEPRELAICTLATVAGMRPGEIFGLKWRHIKPDHLEIEQRLYRGKIDSPKNDRSARTVALSEGLQAAIANWRALSADPSPDDWVFPSETRKTPLAKDNCWRRWIAPKLKVVGLDWVDFHVMRRTHASLMRELQVDPKVVADQLGHSVDVDLNVYTQTGLGQRKEAVNALESALRIM